MKRILIAAPLRQDVDVFREYQKGLDNLEVPEGFTVDRYFVVNDCMEVIQEIRDAEYDTVETGEVYEKDGAVWFGTSGENDDKDRVLVRSDGRPTYYLADIAVEKPHIHEA